jgi:hypothetical protein
MTLLPAASQIMRVGKDALGRMFRAVVIRPRGVDLAVLRGNALTLLSIRRRRAALTR